MTAPRRDGGSKGLDRVPSNITNTAPKLPRRWTATELQAARDIAERNYIASQGPAGVRDAFAVLYAQVEAEVEAVLQRTSNLLALSAETFEADRTLWQVLRFFPGPPLSEENLWTHVGRKFKAAVPAGVEGKLAAVLLAGLDKVRFPWITTGVEPSADQRRIALVATSMLLAQARFNTDNRGQAAQGQEGAVHQALIAAGFKHDATAKSVQNLQPGTFCREKTIYNKKCDVPVRLLDGRLLTLECKVSNTPKNSWKRLNQETVGKSNTWREHLHDQVVTGCVISGVFDKASLVQAQDQGAWIFWQHDLSELEAFVRD